MPVTYNATLKTDRMNLVKTAIDSGGSNGHLKIGTAGMGVVLADIVLNSPCGTVSGDTLTFDGAPLSDASADATGTAVNAAVFASDGTLIISGLTVGTSGADINLSSVSIVATEPVTITSASIKHG